MMVPDSSFDPRGKDDLLAGVPNETVCSVAYRMLVRDRPTTTSTIADKFDLSLDVVRKITDRLVAAGIIEPKKVRLRSFFHGHRTYPGWQVTKVAVDTMGVQLEAAALREALDAGETPIEQ